MRPAQASVRGPAAVTALVTFLLALLLALASCATVDGGIPDAGHEGLTATQLRLLDAADRMLGADRLFVKGRSFTLDCSGLILALYYHAGIDLTRAYGSYTGNGVRRIHSYLADEKLLYVDTRPKPGDIIFWDNSYDSNEDGIWNDELTHVGMVVSVWPDGQVAYIHVNYRSGIVIEYMNLLKPDVNSASGKVLNSPMRMRSQTVAGRPWLASQLMRDFGMGWKLD